MRRQMLSIAPVPRGSPRHHRNPSAAIVLRFDRVGYCPRAQAAGPQPLPGDRPEFMRAVDIAREAQAEGYDIEGQDISKVVSRATATAAKQVKANGRCRLVMLGSGFGKTARGRCHSITWMIVLRKS